MSKDQFLNLHSTMYGKGGTSGKPEYLILLEHLEMFLFKRTISRYREIVGVLYVLGGPALGGCGKGTSHPTSRRCSHVSEMLPGGPALGSEGHVLHPRCLFALLEPLAMAPDSSSLVWPGHRISHPQEMPPSGPGKDPSISTPGECVWCCAVGVGKVECFLLSRSERDLGTTWGPPPSLLGKCPVQCPFHAYLPPLAVQEHESALTAC